MGYVVDPDCDFASKSSTGGGALLGIGTYPLAFITMALGTDPAKVTAVGKLSDNGEVDVFGNVTLEFDGDRFATMQYSLLSNMCENLMILGSKGSIRINSSARTPSHVILSTIGETGELSETISKFPLLKIVPGACCNYPFSENLLYEAEGVINAIQNKQTETSEYLVDESLAIMRLMDGVRKQIGVVYDADKK